MIRFLWDSCKCKEPTRKGLLGVKKVSTSLGRAPPTGPLLNLLILPRPLSCFPRRPLGVEGRSVCMKAEPIFNSSVLNDGSRRHGNHQAGEESEGVRVLLLSVSAVTHRRSADLSAQSSQNEASPSDSPLMTFRDQTL